MPMHTYIHYNHCAAIYSYYVYTLGVKCAPMITRLVRAGEGGKSMEHDECVHIFGQKLAVIFYLQLFTYTKLY